MYDMPTIQMILVIKSTGLYLTCIISKYHPDEFKRKKQNKACNSENSVGGMIPEYCLP